MNSSRWFRRGSRHATGYGIAWDRLRLVILRRDNYLCVPCRLAGRITLAQAVDHIVPKARGGTDALENLQSICRPCHDRKSLEELGKRPRAAFDSAGNPTDPRHAWFKPRGGR